MDLSFITIDLLNDISWFDGIMYIILGLVVYVNKDTSIKKYNDR